jgi:hypothetical protein
MRSWSQFRTAGPQALSSAAWAADLNEVKRLGGVDSTDRTPEQTYIARWWQSSSVAGWNAVARDLAARDDLDVADSARLFALEDLAAADAAINCWNDKYHWDFWRPWNAIPRAAEDGNPATEPDPTWTALITAPYPEHPSGHLCLDGAHTRVLRMFFGDVVEGGYQITSISTLLAPNDPRTPASGPDSTTAPPTCRRDSSARTSPTTWRRTTSSRWVDIQCVRGRRFSRGRPRTTARSRKEEGMKRRVRWALPSVGLAALVTAIIVAPGAATPPSGLTNVLLARGTDVSNGTIPLQVGTDIAMAQITVDPGGSSGWHSHPGGAIIVTGAMSSLMGTARYASRAAR